MKNGEAIFLFVATFAPATYLLVKISQFS